MVNGTEPIGVAAMPLAVSQAFVLASGSRLSHALMMTNLTFRFIKPGISDLLFAGTSGLWANRFRTLDFVCICFYRDRVFLGSFRFRVVGLSRVISFLRIARFTPVQRQWLPKVSRGSRILFERRDRAPSCARECRFDQPCYLMKASHSSSLNGGGTSKRQLMVGKEFLA